MKEEHTSAKSLDDAQKVLTRGKEGGLLLLRKKIRS